MVAVNQYSGLSGIAAWINTYFKLKGENKIDKKDERILAIKEWVDNQYENGRTTIIGNNELEIIVKQLIPDLFQRAS